MELADVIDQSPTVRVIKGSVLRITGDTFTMAYLGGEVPNVSHTDQYTPTVGDIVQVLVIPRGGWLALGSINGTGAGSGNIVYPPVVGIVNADGNATYSYISTGGVWTPGTLVQAPDQCACWFYDTSLFTPFAGAALASFEVEITLTTGGPIDLQLHNTTGPTETLELVSAGPYTASPTPPAGVATWVNAPVGWGETLASGGARGVGIGLGQHTGTYAGTGRLRFTTI